MGMGCRVQANPYQYHYSIRYGSRRFQIPQGVIEDSMATAVASQQSGIHLDEILVISGPKRIGRNGDAQADSISINIPYLVSSLREGVFNAYEIK